MIPLYIALYFIIGFFLARIIHFSLINDWFLEIGKDPRKSSPDTAAPLMVLVTFLMWPLVFPLYALLLSGRLTTKDPFKND